MYQDDDDFFFVLRLWIYLAVLSWFAYFVGRRSVLESDMKSYLSVPEKEQKTSKADENV